MIIINQHQLIELGELSGLVLSPLAKSHGFSQVTVSAFLDDMSILSASYNSHPGV